MLTPRSHTAQSAACEGCVQLCAEETLMSSIPVQVIAVVMDVFTDVDLLCDLVEASNKRRVPVYILLDEKNLRYFTDMCSTLDIQNSHLSVSASQGHHH